jgi:hypothetical protein
MKFTLMFAVTLSFVGSMAAKAGDEITPATANGSTSSIATSSQNTRYGLFDALDHGSSYGSGLYPEPFLVDDTDLEVNEARLDYLHTGGPGNSHVDNIHAEVEKGFGNLTLELEGNLERDSLSGVGSTNFSNVDLGARYPVYQYVDPKGLFDTTFGVGLEVGVPVGSIIARNTEVVPKIFNDFRIENFSLQSILGYSTLIGNSQDDGRQQNFEYGFVFGYTIQHDQIAIPGLVSLVPVFEFDGTRQMNGDDHGDTNVVADVGFRANLEPIGPIQPRLGIAYVFPIDYGARQDLSWGIATSLVFEY